MALISGFVLVPLTNDVIGVAVGIIVVGFLFYGFIAWLGGRLMDVVLIEQEAIQMANNHDNIEIGVIGNEKAER